MKLFLNLKFQFYWSTTSFEPMHSLLSSGLEKRALQGTISTELYQNLNLTVVEKIKHD